MAVSLIQLCLNAAYEVDDVKPYVIQGATSTTVTGVGLGNLTTAASTTTYDGAWAYAANQQRRVRTNGYAPATSILTLNAPWTTNPTPGATLYMTRLAPIGTTGAPGEDTPYKLHVLNALKHLIYTDVVTLPITTDDEYNLGAYDYWLDRPERLLGIREPAPLTNRRPVRADWRLNTPSVERSGTTVYLRLAAPFESGVSGSLTLDVLRPVYTLVNGAESETGPTLDADEVMANPEDVQIGALAYLYLSLAVRQASSPDGADWSRKYAVAKAEFESLMAFDRTRMMPPAPAAAEAA